MSRQTGAQATARAAAAMDGLDEGPRQLMRTAVNLAAAARRLPAPWALDLPAGRAAGLAAAARQVIAADPATWGAAELGGIYEAITAARDRKHNGVWFTPPPVAEAMTRLAIPAGSCDYGNPACGLQVMTLDPACGAGIFLITAARRVARIYAALLSGRLDPPDAAIRFALPTVMEQCVFGVDIDPVAAELARAACWLEAGGIRPFGWMDDNIITGDTLAGDLPKPLRDRLDGPQPLIVTGNPPYRDKARGAAPWIEARRPAGRPEPIPRPSLDEFRRPGKGRTDYVLSSMYVYFWRWALWQAMESRDPPGTVAFITPSAWLKSDALLGMREHMRRCADEMWIIDLSPEGHQAPVNTRIFPGIQTPVCIGVLTQFLDSAKARQPGPQR